MLSRSSNAQDELIAAHREQTACLNKVLDKITEEKPPRQPASMIKIEPKVSWPHLGDEHKGGTEVQDFYDKFEEMCSLANNGAGLADKEMMIAFRTVIHGAKKKIHDNEVKRIKGDVSIPESDKSRKG